eukprot:2990555-Alexandrium_andersonii.AAC.1
MGHLTARASVTRWASPASSPRAGSVGEPVRSALASDRCGPVSVTGAEWSRRRVRRSPRTASPRQSRCQRARAAAVEHEI